MDSLADPALGAPCRCEDLKRLWACMPSWATTTTTSAKKREESASAPGGREELHEMIEALPD
ncbi:hypothetical protein [Desulfofundulus australicus]|uniref:hypothetical protein n=1 Tax=Desulfofundulus australicus TaxID=1566 RepID=UPI0010427AB7|nr:hypothetical protein [Desulfofundulus australicus]